MFFFWFNFLFGKRETRKTLWKFCSCNLVFSMENKKILLMSMLRGWMCIKDNYMYMCICVRMQIRWEPDKKKTWRKKGILVYMNKTSFTNLFRFHSTLQFFRCWNKLFLFLFFSFLQVAWIKSDSKAILAIHTLMVALNPRLSVTHNGHNTWKLHIANVQVNDSGSYMCQGTNQNYYI